MSDSPDSYIDSGEAFSFIFMSDTQADPETGDYEAFGELLDQAVNHESAPKLLVLGGDTVNNGSSAEEWGAFRAAAGGRLDDMTVAGVPGNHDNKPLLAEQFDYPDESAESFFYTFTSGNVFFCMLDSNAMGGGNKKDADWLADQLASNDASGADWRIAVCHHPFWPAIEIPKDIQRAQTMRDVFLPVMEAGGIDLILCGHQHLYARTELFPDMDNVKNKMVQIMVASGAKESYKPGDMDYIDITAEAANYLVVEAYSETMQITAYGNTGETFDNAAINRQV